MGMNEYLETVLVADRLAEVRARAANDVLVASLRPPARVTLGVALIHLGQHLAHLGRRLASPPTPTRARLSAQ